MTSRRPATRNSTGTSARRRAEPVLAGDLRVAEARRQHVGGAALAAALAEPELRDVAADRRLGGPEAPLAEGGRELLLGADRALLDQVADRALAELLHHLHRITGCRQRSHRPSQATTTSAASTMR